MSVATVTATAPARVTISQAAWLLGLAAVFGVTLLAGKPVYFVALLIAVAGFALVMARPLVAFVLALGLMPLEAVGRLVPSVPALTWAKVMLAMTVAVLLVRALVRRERIETPEQFWALLCVLVGGVISSAVGGFGVTIETVKNLFGIGSMVLLVLAASYLVRTERDFAWSSFAVVAGSVPVVVFGLIEVVKKEALFPNPMFAEPLWAPGTTDVFRITSTFYDPNVLGRYLVFAMLWTLAALWLPALRRWRIPFAVLFLAQGYCLVNTFSRAALLTSVLFAGSFLVVKLVKRFHVGGLVVSAGGAVMALVAAWPLVRITVARFNDPTAGGRTGIAAEALHAIGHSPLFGYGRENVPFALKAIAGRAVDPHNLYLEVPLAVGVIGTLALLAFVVPTVGDLLREWRKGDTHAQLLLLPLFGVLFYSLSLHGWDGYELWIPFALALPALRLARERRSAACA